MQTVCQGTAALDGLCANAVIVRDTASWVAMAVAVLVLAIGWPPILAAAFGGALPKLFKLALENRTGLALAAGADDTEATSRASTPTSRPAR